MPYLADFVASGEAPTLGTPSVLCWSPPTWLLKVQPLFIKAATVTRVVRMRRAARSVLLFMVTFRLVEFNMNSAWFGSGDSVPCNRVLGFRGRLFGDSDLEGQELGRLREIP